MGNEEYKIRSFEDFLAEFQLETQVVQGNIDSPMSEAENLLLVQFVASTISPDNAENVKNFLNTSQIWRDALKEMWFEEEDTLLLYAQHAEYPLTAERIHTTRHQYRLRMLEHMEGRGPTSIMIFLHAESIIQETVIWGTEEGGPEVLREQIDRSLGLKEPPLNIMEALMISGLVTQYRPWAEAYQQAELLLRISRNQR